MPMRVDNETRLFIMDQSKKMDRTLKIGFYRWMIRCYNAKFEDW